MTYQALINGKKYDVQPTIKGTQILTTDLDTYEFTINNLSEELDLDFGKYNGLIKVDILIPYGSETTQLGIISGFVSSYQRENIAYNPNKYRYVIQLVSLTFALQRITLPNLTITQPLGDEKKTVLSQIERILKLYLSSYTLGFDTTPLLVPCPEMQFTKSTLYEVLNQLFSIGNYIPIVSRITANGNYIIGAISFKGNETNYAFSYFDMAQARNNASEYSDALDVDIENGINNDSDVKTPWIASTSQEAMVTKDNFIFQLPSNIYEITKVEAILDVYNGVGEGGHVDKNRIVDITERVVAKKVWDSYYSSSTLLINDTPDTDTIKYKRNNLYYEGNIINGNYDESLWGIAPASTLSSLQNAIYWEIKKYPGEQPIMNDAQTTTRTKIMIRVIYKSDAQNIRCVITGDGVEEVKNSMIQNQSDSIIDLNRFAKVSQDTLNRTGNEILTLNKSVKLIDNTNPLTSIPKIGDRIDKIYVITSLTYQLNENNMLLNYEASKNYVYDNSYSVLNQKKRFTSIDTENVLVRNELKTISLKFESVNDSETNQSYTKLLTYLCKCGQVDNAFLHILKTTTNSGGKISEMLLLDSKNKVIGNNIACQISFETNYIAGLKIDGTNLLPVKYTDDNGEFDKITWYFKAGEIHRNDIDYDTIKNYPEVNDNEGTAVQNSIYQYQGLVLKDTREVLSMTIQFRYINTNEIMLYNRYFSLNPLINLTAYSTFKIYSIDDEDVLKVNYDSLDLKPKGTVVENATITFTSNYFEITGVSGVVNHYQSIAVCDENDNLILAVNKGLIESGNLTIKYYLNIKE